MPDAIQKTRKEVECFALVFLFRIFLRVAAQMNALAQIVHRGQMFAPMRIQLLQQVREPLWQSGVLLDAVERPKLLGNLGLKDASSLSLRF